MKSSEASDQTNCSDHSDSHGRYQFCSDMDHASTARCNNWDGKGYLLCLLLSTLPAMRYRVSEMGNLPRAEFSMIGGHLASIPAY